MRHFKITFIVDLSDEEVKERLSSVGVSECEELFELKPVKEPKLDFSISELKIPKTGE